MDGSGPSEAYRRAVAEGRDYHANSKTYSGSLLRPHKPFLTEMIRRIDARSALDVGTGKGVQWQWIDPQDGMTMEQAWGFDVRKYDPCWPPFEQEPEGVYDLVICTHTISLIPLNSLAWFIDRLYAWARKGVFIAEKIGERKKADVTDPDARAIGWTAEKWISRIGASALLRPDVETVLSLRTRESRGTITTRYIWHDRDYRSEEAKPKGE